MSKLTLILGGASSGKSAYAERLVLASEKQPVYLATAQVLDEEMTRKISKHRLRRGPEWVLVEAPIHLSPVLAKANTKQIILLDCLTLWLSNLMEAGQDVEAATTILLTAIENSSAEVIAVSNEIGLGLVPSSALGRKFRDAQGLLNQRFAAAAHNVSFIAAGLPLHLKAQ